jgi:hypothetical protein
VAAPAVGSYVSLLRLLCCEELARLRVWVEPMKYADASKTAPSVSDNTLNIAILLGTFGFAACSPVPAQADWYMQKG